MFWDNSNWDPACRWHMYFQPYSAFTHTMYTYPAANEKEREKLPLSDTPGFFTNYTLDRHSFGIPFLENLQCVGERGKQWMDILLTRFVLHAIACNSVHKQLNVIFTIGTCGLWLTTCHRVSIVKSKWRFAKAIKSALPLRLWHILLAHAYYSLLSLQLICALILQSVLYVIAVLCLNRPLQTTPTPRFCWAPNSHCSWGLVWRTRTVWNGDFPVNRRISHHCHHITGASRGRRLR